MSQQVPANLQLVCQILSLLPQLLQAGLQGLRAEHSAAGWLFSAPRLLLLLHGGDLGLSRRGTRATSPLHVSARLSGLKAFGAACEPKCQTPERAGRQQGDCRASAAVGRAVG